MEALKRFERQGCCGDPKQHGYVDMSEMMTEREPFLNDDEQLDASGQPDSPTGDPSPSKTRQLTLKTGDSAIELDAAAAQARTEQLLRPPRDVCGLLAAGTSVAVGAVVGVAAGYLLWMSIQDATAEMGLCDGVKALESLDIGVDRLGAAALSVYCHNVRQSVFAKALFPVMFAGLIGLACLRLCYGRAYFAEWSELETLGELQRLYSMRTIGARLVLRSWRMRILISFTVEIVVLLWLRYTVDLLFDIQAMAIFWQHEQYKFFSCNLAGIFLGLAWTVYEIFFVLGDETRTGVVSRSEIFIVGLTLPLLGSHVGYLSALSLWKGEKHPFLFISALSEAILESAMSGLIQTYAVITSALSVADQEKLYLSIGMSFVSIGYAFSTLDQRVGGSILVQLPGFCQKNMSLRFIIIFFFRLAETTSRITSVALFQAVTMPVMGHYAMFCVGVIDFIILAVLTIGFQLAVARSASSGRLGFVAKNIFYAVPSVICLMTPMLEKDCVLTMPPWCFYTIRVLELGVMGYYMGEFLDWDWENASHVAHKEGIMVSALVLSTVTMVIFGLVIRWGLTVRVLLEAPTEVYTSRTFNHTQQALRNRIIGSSQCSENESSAIRQLIRAEPDKMSWEYRQKATEIASAEDADEELKDLAGKTLEEWEARYMRAKVSLCVWDALETLEDSMGEHSTRKKSTAVTMRSMHGGDIGGHELRIGSLVSLKGPGGLFTSGGRHVHTMMSTDQADQKFALEPVGETMMGAAVKSGDKIRLRALQDGKMIGIIPFAKETEGENKPIGPFTLGFPPAWTEREDPSTVFTITHVHEVVYSSARKFCEKVTMQDATSLLVQDLKYSKSRFTSGSQSTRELDPHGWRIAVINGAVATREMVDAIRKDGARSGTGTASDNKSEAGKSEAGVSEIGSEVDYQVAKAGSFKICFEKMEGQAPLTFDDRIALRCGGAWSQWATSRVGVIAKGGGLGYGNPKGGEEETNEPPPDASALEAGITAEDPDQGALKIINEQIGCTFRIQKAEYGSKDDPWLYQWAAKEITAKLKKMTEKASLGEKFRIATVAAYNARTHGVENVLGILHVNKRLHLRLITFLAEALQKEKYIHLVYYEGFEEFDDEIEFNEENATQVTVKDTVEDDNYAAICGLRPHDELLQLKAWYDADDIESDEVEGFDFQFFTKVPDLKKVLMDWREMPGDGVRDLSDYFVDMIFLSKQPNFVDPGVQKMAVSHASILATCLPSWTEIKEFDLEIFEAKEHSEARVLAYDGLFRMKCALVGALLEHGWGLQNDGFEKAALALHEHFDAATDDRLQTLFPGEEYQHLREELLIAQLDVLTTAWAHTPRIVKIDKPRCLKKLFRPDFELAAMRDAAMVLFKRWGRDTESFSSVGKIVEMPGPLGRFCERVQPEDSQESSGGEKSVFWIMKAWIDNKKDWEVVEEILKTLSQIYLDADKYWMDRLQGSEWENRRDALQKTADDEDVHVILVPDQLQMKIVQGKLDPVSLELTENLKIVSYGTMNEAPKGSKLLRQGMIEDRFRSASNKQIHKDLMKLKPMSGKEIRLLFSQDAYGHKQAEAEKALQDLGELIKVAKKPAMAFPDVDVEYKDLQEKYHQGQLELKDQEHQRNIRVQQKELDETMKVANSRLEIVEREKRQVQENNRTLETEKRNLMADKSKLEREKQKLISDKTELEARKTKLEEDKNKLTKAYNELEAEKGVLVKEKKKVDLDFEQLQLEQKQLQMKKEEYQKALEQVYGTLESEKAQRTNSHGHLEPEKKDEGMLDGLLGSVGRALGVAPR